MSDVLDSPEFNITYNSKNISKDVANYLISIHYSDTVEGEASEFVIVMEDTDDLWKNGWYPSKGATIECSIGSMDCGSFIIDHVTLSGSPDIIEIKAVSSLSDVPKLDTAQKFALTLHKKLKTKRSVAHENITLLQLASNVAQHNGLTLQGKVPNITIGRKTQRRMTDLKFLRKVSYDYGVIFRVMDKKLVFMSMKEIEQRGPQLTLDKTDLLPGWKFEDKLNQTFAKVTVKHHNQSLKGVVAVTRDVNNADGIAFPQIVGGDTYVVHRKLDNATQATSQADAMLYRKNTEAQTGSISFPGKPTALAGNNVALTGLGTAITGVFHMMKVAHSVTRENGWTVDVDVKKVSGPASYNVKPKYSAQPALPPTPKNKGQASIVEPGAIFA